MNPDPGAPRIYLALVSQAGVAAPTLDSPARYNTFGFEPKWTYVAVGTYDLVFPGPVLVVANTLVWLMNGGAVLVVLAGGANTTSTVRVLTGATVTSNYTDALLLHCTVLVMAF